MTGRVVRRWEGRADWANPTLRYAARTGGVGGGGETGDLGGRRLAERVNPTLTQVWSPGVGGGSLADRINPTLTRYGTRGGGGGG